MNQSKPHCAAYWHKITVSAREQAMAAHLRGQGLMLKGDYPTAIAAYQKALEIFSTLYGESKDMALALNDLGSVEKASGNITAAEKHYRMSLQMARKLGHTQGIAICTINLATVAQSRKDWLEAESLAREALPLAEKIGRQELIAGNNQILAQALAMQGKKAEGLPHASLAVEIFSKLGSPRLKEASKVFANCQS